MFSYVREIFVPLFTCEKSEGGDFIAPLTLDLLMHQRAIPFMFEHSNDRRMVIRSFLSPFLGLMGESSSFGVGVNEGSCM